MTLLREFRLRARHVVAPVFYVSMILYFAVHLVSGERGIRAWADLREHAAEADRRLESLSARQATLEEKVSSLRPDGLDLDVLDERARVMLNLAARDELVLQIPSR